MSKSELVPSSWLSKACSNKAFLFENSLVSIDIRSYIQNTDYNTFKYVHPQPHFHERTGTLGINHEKFIQFGYVEGGISL